MNKVLVVLAAHAMAVWSFLLIYNADLLLDLDRMGGFRNEDLAIVVVPVIGLIASAWTGFFSRRRLTVAVAAMIQALLLALACFLLLIMLASAAG